MEQNRLTEILYKSISPVVCAVGQAYCICIPVAKPALISILIGDEEYAAHDNGVRSSKTGIQKIRIPMTALDAEKQYTVRVRPVLAREPYHPPTLPPFEKAFDFSPIEKTEDIRIYHLSDVHGETEAASLAGRFFNGGKPDLLILNGDISSSSKTEAEILRLFEIAFNITGGSCPVIITRGNHDCRGQFADRLSEYYPEQNGSFFYSVRLGPVWFLVLDCGEDKNDDHCEYGHTAYYHPYRLAETAYIEDVIRNAAREYMTPDVLYKIVLSHIPFMHTDFDPNKNVHEFDIEQPLYTRWCEMLREEIKPDFGLFGHVHTTGLFSPGGRYDNKNFGIPMILGGRPDHEQHNVVGTALLLNEKSVSIRFTDKSHTVLSEALIINNN